MTLRCERFSLVVFIERYEIWRNMENGIAKGQPSAHNGPAEYGVNRDFIVKGIRRSWNTAMRRYGTIRILGLAMFEPVKVRI